MVQHMSDHTVAMVVIIVCTVLMLTILAIAGHYV